MDKTEKAESMTGKETECPKCGLEAKTLLHPFCQHKDCPVRDLFAHRENNDAG